MGMNVTPDLAALRNRLNVNEGDIATNTTDTNQNTQDIATNQGNIQDVDGQITEVQNLRTGVNDEISALQRSLNTEQDDAQITVIEGQIEDLNLRVTEFDDQERGLTDQRTDLTTTGETLARTGTELEANGVRLDGEHTEITAEIADVEAAIKAAEEAEVKPPEETPPTEEPTPVAEEPVTETPAELQVDVPVQNNKGWQYYAELELKAQHGNDPNYKPSDEELRAKANEIKQRNIENGNVKTNGNLVIGTPQDPKYVTLQGDIDTSGLQTTDQALVKYNQGQEKLAREAAEARARAEAEAAYAREMEQLRNFSTNLGNRLEVQARAQDLADDEPGTQENKYTQFYANSAAHTPKGKTPLQAVRDGDMTYSEAAYGNATGQICANFSGSCGMSAQAADGAQAAYLLLKAAWNALTE